MSNVKHQPATPLPWDSDAEDFGVYQLESIDPVTGPLYEMENGEKDSEYICRAANAYPRLVEMVRTLRVRGTVAMRNEADALLRELGEIAA